MYKIPQNLHKTDVDVDVEGISPEIIVRLSYFKENGEWEYQGYSSSSSTGTREGSSTPELTYTLKFKRRPYFHILNSFFNKSVYKRIILESNRKCTKFRKTYIKQTLMSMWKAYRLKLLSNKRRRPVELIISAL
jgi:hypothetical protein